MPKEEKVQVPRALQHRLIDQQKGLVNHPGMTRIKVTIRKAFKLRKLHHEKVEKCCHKCHMCQIQIRMKEKYGHLPPTEVEEEITWKRINVDIVVSPYIVETPKGKNP